MVTVGSSSSLFYFILYLYKYIMVLTRDEKETLVLDLYNHRTPIRDIAREAGMSFRDIGRIIDKEEKEKEAMEGQVQQITQSTQAYKLFSEDKTPEEVAIALNLRQSQVAEYYTEHWKLKRLYMLDQIYEEIKDDIGSFVNLYRSAKAAGMNPHHVNRLLALANNHLPSVEYTYETRKRELEDLEAEKGNSARIYQEINDKILSMSKRLDSLNLDCEKELAQRDQLYQKRMKLEVSVRQFQNNNEEYAKIKKTVEEKVHNILSGRRMVLKLAVLSLIESMRRTRIN